VMDLGHPADTRRGSQPDAERPWDFRSMRRSPPCRITDRKIVPPMSGVGMEVLGIVVLGALTLGAILFAEFSD
jgi:hypothetical protein